MAQLKIDAWDIAELFGLQYTGFEEYTDKYGDANYGYNFEFHGKKLSVNEWQYSGADEAKNAVAANLLLELGRNLVVDVNKVV